MSHFTVLVISDEDQNPEDQLAPFQEDCGDEDFDKDLLEFDTEVEPDEFQAKAREIVDDQTDEKVKDKYTEMLGCGKYKEIIIDYNGYEEDENGNLGYYSNPDAHWDWYELGGRWTGMLKVKDGIKPLLGGRGWRSVADKIKKNHCDQALVKDIDFEGMLKDEVKDAKKLYDKAITILEEEIKKGQPLDKARVEANWKTGVDLCQYKSKVDYVEMVRSNGFYTHAFITPDGEWIEKAGMGWFGCTSNEKPDEYRRQWDEMIKNLKPEQTLSVYDCHI
jgi:hypothetical protein